MSKINSHRKGCKDIFNAFWVASASYEGIFEFPCIKAIHEAPNRMISFSKALSCTDYNQWVHFYKDDFLFERIWRNPQRYLEILKKYNGVILPDFSLYRDMPLVMQLWNIYRSRAIGHWLQSNGIKVIVNIRFGDHRTFKYSCDGAPKNSIIAVGTHGTLKHKKDRDIFIKGLESVIERLHPTTIVVYGSAPDYIFDKYIKAGIQILQFDSDIAASHKEVI